MYQMENTESIKRQIIELINNKLLEKVIDIKTLPASGSSRIYFRVITANKTLIATYNSNIEENNAFLVFDKHFENKKISAGRFF